MSENHSLGNREDTAKISTTTEHGVTFIPATNANTTAQDYILSSSTMASYKMLVTIFEKYLTTGVLDETQS